MRGRATNQRAARSRLATNNLVQPCFFGGMQILFGGGQHAGMRRQVPGLTGLLQNLENGVTENHSKHQVGHGQGQQQIETLANDVQYKWFTR